MTSHSRFSAHGLVMLSMLASVACHTPAAAPPPPAATIAVEQSQTRGVGHVTRAFSEADIPMRGVAYRFRAGDWILQTDSAVAVVSATEGRLIGFGPRGGENAVNYIDPTAYDALSSVAMDVEHGEVQSGVLHLVKRALTKPFVLHVWIHFDARHVLHIESQAVADDDEPVVAASLGELYAWGNTPTWIEGHGFPSHGGNYGGRYLARSSQGRALAACSRDGRLIARLAGSSMAGFHRSARTGEVLTRIPPGGSSPRRRIALSFADGGVGDAASRLPCAGWTDGGPTWRLEQARAAGAPKQGWLDVARCDGDDPPTPITRFSLANRNQVPMPDGCVRARLTAPGHAPGRWVTRDDELASALPEAGELRWSARDASGRSVPAKLIMHGIAGTPDPDWGEDGRGGTAKRHAYGQSGTLAVPPGTYQLTIGRGFEYSRHDQQITISRGEPITVEAVLERVVDTTGWLAADLHVHAHPSFDAPVQLEDRVRSLAGVGVEVAVATDHNAVTDYTPAIRALALEPFLMSIVGDEITTEDTRLGHFNLFPLPAGSPPVRWRNIAPAQLVAAARARSPHGVLQVNHPRMGSIGYFNVLHLDRQDVTGWRARAPLADMRFDAIEVFSGDHYDNIGAVRDVMEDWFALLNAGMRYTATGNSDSHKIAYQEAGVPRSYIAVDKDQPEGVSEREVIDAIRSGRVTVSSGPFLELFVAGQAIGGTAAPGLQKVRIRLQAPDWVTLDSVELLVRGRRAVELPVTALPFDTEVTLDLKQGDWVIATATGQTPMTTLYRRGALPFAFTNPVWVH